jgi:hypothetical protein
MQPVTLGTRVHWYTTSKQSGRTNPSPPYLELFEEVEHAAGHLGANVQARHRVLVVLLARQVSGPNPEHLCQLNPTVRSLCSSVPYAFLSAQRHSATL